MSDPRNMPQPDTRNMVDPRSVYDPRNPQDQRNVADQRNLSQQDLKNASDPRNFAPDPRTASQQDPRGYNMQRFPSLRGDPGPYGYPANRDMPPELPPPPMDDHEDLPPLPPPPRDLYDHQLEEEQLRLMETLRKDPDSPASSLQQYDRYSQPQPYNDLNRQSHSSLNRLPPSSVANYTPHSAVIQPVSQPQPPNYQNINFVSEVRADAGPAGQVPASNAALPPQTAQDQVYEPYASRLPPGQAQGVGVKPTTLYRPGQQLPAQQQQPPSQAPPLTPSGGLNKNSAWDREEKEKAEAQQAEDLFQLREQEIADLESRSYLSIQDQERLRKLKLEHEFQRRVREVDEKGDYDADEDDEIMERLFTRDRLIQSLKDDLEKSKQKIVDFDHRQMVQDLQLERERMQRLERRLEMMEKDRQEVHERMEKRHKRRAKDHQDQLRVQRVSMGVLTSEQPKHWLV